MSNQKGVSLYLAIMIMSMLSAVVLGLISISISGIKIAQGLENSVMAFYAANTGIERALYNIRKSGDLEGFSDTLEQTSYDVTITVDGEKTTIKSIGTYRDTQRAIEANY